MIKVENLVLKGNKVLVKVDEDYETYQMNGRDTGIKNALSVGTAGQRTSVFGTIVSVPEKLCYRGDEIKSIRRQYGEDSEYGQTKADYLKKVSTMYDVPMEVKPGDRVMFLYKVQFDAYKDGSVLYTDQGTLMLIDYSFLHAIVKGEDELYPLNGFVFVNAFDFKFDHVSDAGLIRIAQQHMGQKIKRASSPGRVVEVGCRVKGYLDFPVMTDLPDDTFPISVGDYLFYDGRMSRNLQFHIHQTLKTARVMIHRKDILGIITDKTKFEFAE